MKLRSVVNPSLFVEPALNFIQSFQTVSINSIFSVERNCDIKTCNFQWQLLYFMQRYSYCINIVFYTFLRSVYELFTTTACKHNVYHRI